MFNRFLKGSYEESLGKDVQSHKMGGVGDVSTPPHNNPKYTP